MAKAKKKAYKPRPLKLSPFLKVPLSTEEHASLSNPPDMAYLRFKDGTALRQDLWTLWFRCRTTLTILRNCHAREVDVIAQVQALTTTIQTHFLNALAQKLVNVSLTIDEIADVRVFLDLANEVQKETNRHHQLEVYKLERAYCRKTAGMPAD